MDTIWPRLRFLQLHTRGPILFANSSEKLPIEISGMTGLKPREGVESVRATEPDPIFALIDGDALEPHAWVLTDSRRQSARNFLHEGCGLRNANPRALSWDPASILRCQILSRP